MNNTRLTFDMAQLRPIIEHARAAKEFRAAYGRKAEPSLFFVKDAGIYLMSAGLPGLKVADGVGYVVAYADGFGPTARYEALKEAVGGDDFSEVLPLEYFTTALYTGAVKIHVTVLKREIKVENEYLEYKK